MKYIMVVLSLFAVTLLLWLIASTIASGQQMPPERIIGISVLVAVNLANVIFNSKSDGK